MLEFDNPSFPQLGVEVALASGLLLPELLQLQVGALEVALEAPEIFLAAPEMVPTTELARELELQLEKDLVRIPEIEPVMALGIAQGIAQSNRWVLSSRPLASFVMVDLRTWLNIVLPAALGAPASLEVELISTAKALEQNLEVATFAASFCGLKEIKI